MKTASVKRILNPSILLVTCVAGVIAAVALSLPDLNGNSPSTLGTTAVPNMKIMYGDHLSGAATFVHINGANATSYAQLTNNASLYIDHQTGAFNGNGSDGTSSKTYVTAGVYLPWVDGGIDAINATAHLKNKINGAQVVVEADGDVSITLGTP